MNACLHTDEFIEPEKPMKTLFVDYQWKVYSRFNITYKIVLRLARPPGCGTAQSFDIGVLYYRIEV